LTKLYRYSLCLFLGNFLIAGLNGKTYKIKRGEPVKVPRDLERIIVASAEAKDANEVYIENILKKEKRA
jgi:hypothetical protein